MTTTLYTPEETAAFFRVGKGTVLRWAREDQIGCYRQNGRVVRFSQEHIDAKLKATDTAQKPARKPSRRTSAR